MSDQAGDRLRVLLLNYEYPPLGGGAANATAHLVREFTRYPALSMDIVTSSTGPGRVEKAGGVAIHFLDIGKRGGLHHQSMRDLIAYSWRAYRYAARLLGRERYDLCHAFFGIPCGWIARR
ncbi:MAG: glycosyltransferase family 4 protein, partial [Candidatus Hydrogenedentes bacterium]|nr:glycosyltransferase family 4 protein [Candidatus Hydrogenedentota bacterium]